jgi:peptidoglycan/LPS O-acetylase OafA/YrhL
VLQKRQLDGLRFFAFLLVFISHLAGFPSVWAAEGVNLFFVLSGFLITRIILFYETGSIKHDLGVFYARRTLRIFPLYYATLIVLLPFGLLPYPAWHFVYLWNVKIFLLGHSVSLVNHYWSLCVEEQFYLTFPPLILLTKKSLRPYLIAALILSTLAARCFFAHCYPGALYDLLLPVRGQYLLWGCLAGYLELSTLCRTVNGTVLFFLGLFLNGIWFALYFSHIQMLGLGETFSGISMALIVFGLWRCVNPLVLSVFTLPPLVYLGKISYGLYILHWFSVMVSALIGLKVPALLQLNQVVVRFALTVIMAALSWHFFENPINNLKRKFPYGARRSASEQI